MKTKMHLTGWIGLIVLAFLLIGQYITPFPPNLVNMELRLQPPDVVHWFGTDHLGRDMLSRILAGGWQTVGTSFAVLVLSIGIGAGVGLVSGYKGGRIDWVLMRFSDAFMSFPDYIVAIVLSGILGNGNLNLILAISAVKWVGYARLARSIVLSEKQKEYITIARLNGMSSGKIVYKHLLPHVASSITALAVTDVGKIILMISSLSYIGLGVQLPNPEWGAMLNDGRSFFQTSAHLMLIPGMAIFFTVLLANLYGNYIAAQFNERRSGEVL